MGTAVDMMRSLKENSISKVQADRLAPEERNGKIVRGVLYENDTKPEYLELYDQMVERAQAAQAARPKRMLAAEAWHAK
jgi:hypothetical protein